MAQFVWNIRDVLSGHNFPSQVMRIDRWLEENQLSGIVQHTPLSTVFRGTRKIIVEWSNFFSSNSNIPAVKVSHDICGQEVLHYTSVRCADIFKKLSSEMKPFLMIASSPGESHRNHIVVICEIAYTTTIRSYLASEGIPCGSVEEQVNMPNLVAVDSFTNCLSYEWPIVFLVLLGADDYLDSKRLIACSRAMARLIILERDFMSIQRNIDRELCLANCNLREMDSVDFSDIVDAGREEISGDYFNEELEFVDSYHAIVRNNYSPTELRRLEVFADCDTFLKIVKRAYEVPITYW